MKTRPTSSREAANTPTRVYREAQAFDEGRATENNKLWVSLVPHVMDGPNSIRGERVFDALLSERAAGARAMDVGCGTGELSAQLHAMGAMTVHGFDVSPGQIERARESYGELEGVSFYVHVAETPITERFDLIVGKSILHHVDIRGTLTSLYEENLAPGGRMMFWEPLSHPIGVAFHRFVPSAHTDDEWPLTPTDIAWMRERFDARVLPVNLLSYPAGIISSLALRSEDNWLMNFADTIDRSVERRRRLLARGRAGIIVIDRPANGEVVV